MECVPITSTLLFKDQQTQKSINCVPDFDMPVLVAIHISTHFAQFELLYVDDSCSTLWITLSLSFFLGGKSYANNNVNLHLHGFCHKFE